MKKLMLSLVVSTLLFCGAHTALAECGQQHAEKCLMSDTDNPKGSTEYDKLKMTDKLWIAVMIFYRTWPPF